MKDLIITIFGSTGDLTSRKLLPAITKLYLEKQITSNVLVIALGRKDYNTDTYLEKITTNTSLNISVLKDILIYHKIEITDINNYDGLNELIKSNSNKDTKLLYYLAIGPELFPVVSRAINKNKLVNKGNMNHAIIFEKPFGNDLTSAKEINQLLWSFFDEKQIYRIDHYLGKEMIQNIMMVRFANRIFEDSWHNRTIKSVQIIAKEISGIFGRAGYYDKSGALKDMVQSHLLQILSLLAMEVPLTYFSEDVKDEKVKVLSNLSFDSQSVIFGQYQGYLDELNIPNDSSTDTFVFFKAFVNTPRFKGVPFYLLTGKKLDKKESLVIIEFEETNEQRKWGLPLSTNKLFIRISPKDGVGLVLNSKTPGLQMEVEQVELEYSVSEQVVGNHPEAYEKLFLDITNNHKTLFTRWDEIELSWQFIDELKRNKNDLIIYNDYDELKKLIYGKTGVLMK